MVVNLEKSNSFEQNLYLLLIQVTDQEIKQLIEDYAEQIIKLSERNEQSDRRSIINKIKEIVEDRAREAQNESI